MRGEVDFRAQRESRVRGRAQRCNKARGNELTCLSIVENGLPALAVANPIFVISSIQELRDGTELIFEVFEDDAAALRPLVGQARYYALNSSSSWGILKSLGPCDSTHPGLAHLRHKRTLRGVLATFEEAVSKQQ
jgi:hypothetical protein